MTDLQKLSDAIVAGRLEPAVETTREAIASGVDPQAIISQNMIPAMQRIGRLFEQGEAFVPELLMAARAMKGALELLKPLLTAGHSATMGKVVIGTVYGDLHDIGKNLVASMLEGCGFEVVNLGVNITAGQFVEAVEREGADLLCLSALLTTTMNYMQEVIEEVERKNLRSHVKIMVGGAPVNRLFADRIGADGYSDNANSAVLKARELIGKTL